MAMQQANRDYKNGTAFMAPFLLTVLVIFGYILTEIVDSLWFNPWLLTIGVFYWTLYYPRSTPIWFALILGLLEDGLSGTPFGLYGIGILLMHYLTYHQRQSLVHSPSTVIFTGFLINSFMVNLVMALIMWGVGLPLFNWTIMTWLTTAFMFMPVVAMFGYIRQRMMKD